MAHVLAVGAGAIGSHAATLVARSPLVDRITVVDPQSYAADNLFSQNITSADVGKSKAQTQVRKLQRIRPDVAAAAFAMPVEAMPLGRLRADLILGCVDSRRTRMAINRAASRLGIPWIDAGLDASGLVRVQGFMPAPGAPCLECGWDESDYALVEQAYPCAGDAAAPATASSAALASLAASLLAIECEKLLAGDRATALIGRDVMVDARHHRHFVTAFRRNPRCRMPDHDGWQIQRSPLDPMSTTFADLVAAVAPGVGVADIRLAVAGCAVARGATCDTCGVRTERLVLARRAQPNTGRCERCGGTTAPVGFDLCDEIGAADVDVVTRHRALSAIGVTTGDVVTVTAGGVVCRMELTGGGS